MTSERIAQTNQQQKSEKSQASGILQRAAVRSVSDAGVQSTEDKEAQPSNNSALSKDFSRVPISTTKSQQIMTKLMIGAVGDKYEQEADRVAAQVVQRINAPPVQSGEDETVQRETMETKDNQARMMRSPILQSKSSDGGMAATLDLEASINRARGGGQTLTDNIREAMEQAFGADFSGVKVHTDTQADQLNQSIQAKAFTTGQDVFFRQGAYEPGSRGGQELIAHELTHVVQQNGGAVRRSPNQILRTGQPSLLSAITVESGNPVIWRMYDTKAGRGILWRNFNRSTKAFDLNDLPPELKTRPWRGVAIPDENFQTFFNRGFLWVELPDNLAREAYLGQEGQAAKPFSATVNDRMFEEHCALSNEDAREKSLRRFNEAPGSTNIGYNRTFSWVISGTKALLARSAVNAVKNNGKARASIYFGAQQLGITMPSVSTRQVDVERKEYKTRDAAISAHAKNILPDPDGSKRVSGVTLNGAGGAGNTTITGGWNCTTNVMELYHYAAGGLGVGDAMLRQNKQARFISNAHGTPATMDQASTHMPVRGVLPLVFG
ncbi:eCIS core domain-containing protein [Nostoc sp.]|uniref:eCIS core domain-containing protein n=1 Tax=Nostoc sp. TaxID=1180 RepID=UPI002FF648AB